MVNKKKQESGRSMVEMLGVLAIIGVLSIGGIAGYTLSMRKHRANHIVDIVNKYAFSVYAFCQQKISNGEIETMLDCRHIAPTFEETNIGQLPAGISNVYSYRTIIHNGSDAADIVVEFTDTALCKPVENITPNNFKCENNNTQLGIRFYYDNN